MRYANGDEVPADLVEALKWLSLAASRVSPHEQPDVAAARDYLAARMSSAQMAEAHRRIDDWHHDRAETRQP